VFPNIDELSSSFRQGAINAREYLDVQVDRILDAIDKNTDAVRNLADSSETVRREYSTQADGTGAATLEVTDIRPDQSLTIERLTVVAGAGSSATVYVDAVRPVGQVLRIADASNFVGDIGKILVRRKVFIVVAGAPANGRVDVGLQGIVRSLDA
jgi:hypothetical protein